MNDEAQRVAPPVRFITRADAVTASRRPAPRRAVAKPGATPQWRADERPSASRWRRAGHCSHEHRDLLEANGLVASTSAKGNWYNAAMKKLQSQPHG
jgi:hypothetical protein